MATAKQLKSRYKRKEITKKFLKGLMIGSAVYIAASSPTFVFNLIRNLDKINFKNLNKKEKKQVSDVFSYLKRRELIKVKTVNNQIYISLTKQGRKKAKDYQIDELEIAKPKKWDYKWRILMFDIPEKSKLKREALRGKLKELGFTMVQRSIWVHPFPCHEEIKMLKDFFGFTNKDYLSITTDQIGQYTIPFKKIYKL